MGITLIAALGVALVAIGLVGVATHFVDSRRQYLIVAGSVAPFLMAAAVPGLVLFGVIGQWFGFAAGAAVLAAALATQWPLLRARRQTAAPGTAAPGTAEIVLMQANIWVGSADPDAVVAAVDRLEVDVLTVCELTPDGLDKLTAAGLSDRLPYSFTSTGMVGDGTGIWSRYPITDEQRHDGFETELLSARVCLPDGPDPLVFAVHPVPPWPRKPSDWLRELELLRQLLAKVPDDAGPVLVSGDFNATYDHVQFRNLLDDRYRDAALCTGAGILATYPAHTWYPPIIAIDHILVRDATPTAVHPVELPGSDHRGLWARIAV